MEICLKHGSKNILVEPKSKVTTSAQYNVAHLHPQTMSLAIINFLHLTVLETESRQDIQTHGHYSKVKSNPDHTLCCRTTPPPPPPPQPRQTLPTKDHPSGYQG